MQFCEICGNIKSYDNKFFFTPLFCCCFWIRDPGWVKIRIRDKHPGSATLLINVSCLFLSVPPHLSKAEYILTTMNVKLLAASALSVQSGALLVIYQLFFAIVQCKPTQVCSAPACRQVTVFGGTSKGIMTSILPLKRATEN